MRLRLSLAISFALGAASLAGDWPQFRGPDSMGIAADDTLPRTPTIEWSVPLPGRGLASPIVVGGKVFVTCSSGTKQERHRSEEHTSELQSRGLISYAV